MRKIRNLKKLILNKIQESELRLTVSSKRFNQKNFGLTLYLAIKIKNYNFSPYMVMLF